MGPDTERTFMDKALNGKHDWTLLKRLALLAAPMALQNVISFSVGLTDNLIVGSLGELALSGVFIANQFQNLIQMLVIGLSSAMMVLASQYWGKRDGERVKSIIGITLKFGLACTLFMFLLTLFFPGFILGLFTNDSKVVLEGMKYLSIIRFSYLFFCITQILIASMRVVERVKIGMFLSLCTFVVNLFLNWLLVFGNLGAPKLGIRGSAIATLSVRILECAIMVFYVIFVDVRLRLKFQELLHTDRELLKRFLKYGLPVIIGDLTWGINLATQGAIIGHLGATATAAVSLSTVIFQMVGVVVYGTAGATAIIIGQTVGSGDIEKVKRYSRSLQVYFLIIGLFSGLALFLVREPILLLYNLSPEAKNMALRMMTVLSVTIIGTSYQMSSLTGIVRAGGATHFVLVNDLIHIWCFVIPASLLAAFVFHADPVVVFALLKSDQILKCFVAVIKVNRFKWIRNLTHEASSPA